jgi:hypothetical protein
LGGLIPTAKHEESRWTALHIIHTVTRTVVNPQFPDTTTDRVHIAEIAETDAGKTSTNTGTGLRVTQLQ